MPKSFFFLLFTLFLLRGQANAQNCDSLRPRYSLHYPSFCNAPATVTITYPPIHGVTYTFKLDGVASVTNTWQNVTFGRHTLGYSGSNGCVKADTAIYLASNTLQLVAEQQPVTNCTDTMFPYKLTAIGGHPPYTFKINNRAETSNNLVQLPRGIYTIVVKDAVGCTNENGYLNVVPRRDSVRGMSIMMYNSPCDSLATFVVSVTDPHITRPFTMSLNGGAFTRDTIFRNVLRNGPITFVVRSAQGCLYYAMPHISGRVVTPLQVILNTACANRFGNGGSITASIYGSGVRTNYLIV